MIQTLLKNIETTMKNAEKFYLSNKIINFKKGCFEQVVANALYKCVLDSYIRI